MNADVTDKGFTLGKATLYFGLGLGALLSIFPFYWLVVMSTNTTNDIFRYPPKLTLGAHLIENIQKVLDAVPFFQSFMNSLFVACVQTILVLFFCSMAGFAFAKLEFPGKKFLFTFLLATMMVPHQLGIVPLFIIMQKLGWINTFKALIVPNMATAFGIFWMRQYTSSVIPDELLNAGRIDGCNSFDLYWRISLPVLRPALATLAILTFLGSWNEYMWALIVLTDKMKFTIQVMMSSLNGVYNTDYSMVMAATLMATVPLIVVFSIFSRQFIAGLMSGSIKD